jgi:hypothetical protein
MKKQIGYSKTPLIQKLGIKEGYTIQAINAPIKYSDFFEALPVNVTIKPEGIFKEELDFIHLFSISFRELESGFTMAKKNLKKTGILWISWPKKSSKIDSELDKFCILDYGLRNGLVDTKVAAIDKTWSGHKFMFRVENR